MNTYQSHIAFVSLSSFTPKTHLRASQTVRHASTSSQNNAVTMVAPKHVRRNEEIKRLTKQLEQLRAVRDRMKSETSSPPSSSSTPPEPLKSSAPSPVPSPPTKPSSFTVGKHSEGSRFLSIADFPSDQYFPRILPVAGTVPGLTVAQLEALPCLLHSKQPQLGNVFVTKVPNEYDGELIALSLPENILEYADPVVLKVEPNELSSSQLPCDDTDYVYVVLDRGTTDSSFDDTKFYAWDVDGMVKVGWAKHTPAAEEARCLGRALYGTLELRKELRKKRSCWEEENETYG